MPKNPMPRTRPMTTDETMEAKEENVFNDETLLINPLTDEKRHEKHQEGGIISGPLIFCF